MEIPVNRGEYEGLRQSGDVVSLFETHPIRPRRIKCITLIRKVLSGLKFYDVYTRVFVSGWFTLTFSASLERRSWEMFQTLRQDEI